MTSTQKPYPSRVNLSFQRKKGQVVLDQVRTIDRDRLLRRLGRISPARASELLSTLQEMFSP